MSSVDFVCAVIIAACASIGVWTAFGEGMIFARIGRALETHIHPTLAKPIATCPRCMVSVWGTVALVVVGYHFGVDLNLDPESRVYIDGDLLTGVRKVKPIIQVDWSELVKLPLVLLCATGLQEMLHR